MFDTKKVQFNGQVEMTRRLIWIEDDLDLDLILVAIIRKREQGS